MAAAAGDGPHAVPDEIMLRIGPLIRYAGVAALAGTLGFLAGAGKLPDRLGGAPREIAAQARTTADALHGEDVTVTGALNYVRTRVSDGIHRMAELLDDDD